MISNQWAIRYQTIRQQVLSNDTDTDYTLYIQEKLCFHHSEVRQPLLKSPPKFRQSQLVCFRGGTGTIRSCYLVSGTWAYTIEMALGPEPDVGRVGSEITIFLDKIGIQAGMN